MKCRAFGCEICCHRIFCGFCGLDKGAHVLSQPFMVGQKIPDHFVR